MIALGANPDAAERYDGAQMDTIVEVDSKGTLVWEWRFRDHLVQDIDSSKRNYVGRGRSIADYPQRLDINWGVVSPDYMHCNGLDYNPETGHIAVSCNRTREILIIDHDGTFVAGDPEESHRLAASEAGDFLYRFGNPANYGQGEYPHYAKKNWALQEFSGHHGSSVQRLPNGNTLVQLARVGRMVEVTPDGEVIWEYVNPVTWGGQIVKTLITSDPDHQNVFNGWSPLRWAPDYPGLAGKDLSPKGAVTGCTGIPNCWNDGAPAPDGVTIYDETDAMAAINRGDGDLRGIEVEANWIATDNWSFRGTLALMDNTYSRHPGERNLPVHRRFRSPPRTRHPPAGRRQREWTCRA